MKRTRIVHALLAAVLAITGSACERIDDVAAPAAPQFNNGNSAQARAGWQPVRRGLSGAPGEGWITPSGGTLTLHANGTHTLTVLRQTLQTPTWFSMRPLEGEETGVKLSAGYNNDVGSAGFRQPVILCLDYSQLRESLQGSTRVAIALKRDGNYEVVPGSEIGISSTIARVCANLWHFSQYVMVSD